MRAHLLRPLQDAAGNLVTDAIVRVLMPGTTTLIVDTLYVDDSSGLTLSNPWETTSGSVNFYLQTPQRVRIGVTVGTAPEAFIEDVDVATSNTESTHLGAGAQSTQVGLDAAATGASSTAAGVGATASGGQSTALGHFAQAVLDQTTSVGDQAASSQPGATAVGTSAVASGTGSTALGAASLALYNHTTVLGAGAAATTDHQVMLGTRTDIVEAPGSVVLTSPGGVRFQLIVTDSGMLLVQELAAPAAPVGIDVGSDVVL